MPHARAARANRSFGSVNASSDVTDEGGKIVKKRAHDPSRIVLE